MRGLGHSLSQKILVEATCGHSGDPDVPQQVGMEHFLLPNTALGTGNISEQDKVPQPVTSPGWRARGYGNSLHLRG